MVLLKNDNHTLPLDRTKVKKLAVVGPNAGDVHLGGYSEDPGRGVSVLQGIKDKAGAGSRSPSPKGRASPRSRRAGIATTSSPAIRRRTRSASRTP